MLPGHGGPLDLDFVAEQINWVNSLLAASVASEVYHSFAGDGHLSKHKRASVVFGPVKLRVEK